MKALEDRILKDGQVLPGDILRVGSFLNQQVDVKFINEIADEMIGLYKGQKITKILTIEASGIAIAFAVASKLGVPMVYARKSKAINLSPNVYRTNVYSYTQKFTHTIVVNKEFMSSDDSILIVDDFLAYGNALRGMIDLARQADATIVGAAIAIEKGYQGGGDKIRDNGVRVDSLAVIKSMDDGVIVFE